MLILGIILVTLSILAVAYDIITGKLQIIGVLIFIVIPAILGIMLISGARESLVVFVAVAVGLTSWIGAESIYEKLNDVVVDRTKTKSKRLGLFLLSTFMFGLLRYMLYPVMSSFLGHLRQLISIPRFVSVVITFIVTYCITILIFGMIYAALHVAFEKKGFRSGTPLQLRDFLLYSAFNMATQGYKDMMPEHWILSSLSIFQIFVGIVLLGIYLAGAFTFVIQTSPIK